MPENCYEGYASDRLNGWLNDACVGGGPTPYPGVKEGPKQPCDLGLVRELVSRGASPRLTGALHTAAANDQARRQAASTSSPDSSARSADGIADNMISGQRGQSLSADS